MVTKENKIMERRKPSMARKAKPGCKGMLQKSESPMPERAMSPCRTRPTSRADRKIEASQVSGGQGLVSTIFTLRLRRWDERANRPRLAVKIMLKVTSWPVIVWRREKRLAEVSIRTIGIMVRPKTP